MKGWGKKEQMGTIKMMFKDTWQRLPKGRRMSSKVKHGSLVNSWMHPEVCCYYVQEYIHEYIYKIIGEFRYSAN